MGDVDVPSKLSASKGLSDEYLYFRRRYGPDRMELLRSVISDRAPGPGLPCVDRSGDKLRFGLATGQQMFRDQRAGSGGQEIGFDLRKYQWSKQIPAGWYGVRTGNDFVIESRRKGVSVSAAAY
ncbi:hypothetical protein AB5N19_05705 [Seiridium cardinale]|uniref:Uncharacterized protein n=1 Tax=Seiridium cardinale TaxID=138064 RepID=A0ABR2XJT6_9PEZI